MTDLAGDGRPRVDAETWFAIDVTRPSGVHEFELVQRIEDLAAFITENEGEISSVTAHACYPSDLARLFARSAPGVQVRTTFAGSLDPGVVAEHVRRATGGRVGAGFPSACRCRWGSVGVDPACPATVHAAWGKSPEGAVADPDPLTWGLPAWAEYFRAHDKTAPQALVALRAWCEQRGEEPPGSIADVVQSPTERGEWIGFLLRWAVGEQ